MYLPIGIFTTGTFKFYIAVQKKSEFPSARCRRGENKLSFFYCFVLYIYGHDPAKWLSSTTPWAFPVFKFLLFNVYMGIPLVEELCLPFRFREFSELAARKNLLKLGHPAFPRHGHAGHAASPPGRDCLKLGHPAFPRHGHAGHEASPPRKDCLNLGHLNSPETWPRRPRGVIQGRTCLKFGTS